MSDGLTVEQTRRRSPDGTRSERITSAQNAVPANARLRLAELAVADRRHQISGDLLAFLQSLAVELASGSRSLHALGGRRIFPAVIGARSHLTGLRLEADFIAVLKGENHARR